MTLLRMLTLNALMKDDVRARLRLLGPILEAADHDVVCLQEVMYRANAGLIGSLARSHGYRAHTGAVVLAGGLVTLSRLPVSGVRFERYPVGGPVRPELIMRKGAQVLVVGTAGGPVAVVNTHLSANRDDDWSAGNRYTRVQRAELRHLAGIVTAIDPALPVVVAGDLNVPRSSPVLAEFLAAAGLLDTRAGDPEPTYRPTEQWPSPPAFDHVLVRPGLAARTRLVLRDAVIRPGGEPVFLSDHYGIEARLDVSRK
ncbi:endonuclease/exonuclease/phosphatase family protein [Actinoplanes sp. NPDC051494]|uniref:endonuclease/exonuclease/phosphatase family protein n=1 Tax=Actinoplanes sp. NPDC051494 TaxID=3363907 RepID=UPI0037A7E88C